MQSKISSKIAAIILAAGSSTRMGTSKQLLQIHGEKLLTRTIKTVASAGIDNIVVVLGAGEQAIRPIVSPHKVDVVVNEDWQRGMGSSIKSGLQHLTSAHTDLDAVIIFVCDQPMLTQSVISVIISTYQRTHKPVVASGYSGSAGVPALFARSHFDNLNELADDHGAKKVILQTPADVVVVPFPGGEIDLDTIEDYRKFVSEGEADDQ